MLVIVRTTCVFSHTLKREHRDWRIKDESCSVYASSVMSARIPDEDACYRACNLCVFSCVKKNTLGLMHKGCILQRVSLGALRDVMVVLGIMRQSIGNLNKSNMLSNLRKLFYFTPHLSEQFYFFVGWTFWCSTFSAHVNVVIGEGE